MPADGLNEVLSNLQTLCYVVSGGLATLMASVAGIIEITGNPEEAKRRYRAVWSGLVKVFTANALVTILISLLKYANSLALR